MDGASKFTGTGIDSPIAATGHMATLADLRDEEKAKISNLLRELVRAKREGASATAERREYQSKLLNLRSQNSQIIQETVELRSKFRHSLGLLKTYQSSLAARGETVSDTAAVENSGAQAPLVEAAAEQPASSGAGASATARAAPAHNSRAEAIERLRSSHAATAFPVRATPVHNSRAEVMQRLRERFPRAASACAAAACNCRASGGNHAQCVASLGPDSDSSDESPAKPHARVTSSLGPDCSSSSDEAPITLDACGPCDTAAESAAASAAASAGSRVAALLPAALPSGLAVPHAAPRALSVTFAPRPTAVAATPIRNGRAPRPGAEVPTTAPTEVHTAAAVLAAMAALQPRAPSQIRESDSATRDPTRRIRESDPTCQIREDRAHALAIGCTRTSKLGF